MAKAHKEKLSLDLLQENTYFFDPEIAMKKLFFCEQR
jgi:hypothetical protein